MTTLCLWSTFSYFSTSSHLHKLYRNKHILVWRYISVSNKNVRILPSFLALNYMLQLYVPLPPLALPIPTPPLPLTTPPLLLGPPCPLHIIPLWPVFPHFLQPRITLFLPNFPLVCLLCSSFFAFLAFFFLSGSVKTYSGTNWGNENFGHILWPLIGRMIFS